MYSICRPRDIINLSLACQGARRGLLSNMNITFKTMPEYKSFSIGHNHRLDITDESMVSAFVHVASGLPICNRILDARQRTILLHMYIDRLMEMNTNKATAAADIANVDSTLKYIATLLTDLLQLDFDLQKKTHACLKFLDNIYNIIKEPT